MTGEQRPRGKCDRTEIYCHCSACPDHCPHVCAENEFLCCRVQAMMDAKCPFCGEGGEKCECHTSTHGG